MTLTPEQLIAEFVAAQKDLPADAAKILRDHFWELLGGEPVAPPTPPALPARTPSRAFAGIPEEYHASNISHHEHEFASMGTAEYPNKAVSRPLSENTVSRAPSTQTSPTWEPMSSAPRDGTPILVFRGRTIDVCRECLIELVTWDSMSDGWLLTENIYVDADVLTHWMPLPDPPAAEGERRAAQETPK